MRSLARREESRTLCPAARADGRGDRPAHGGTAGTVPATSPAVRSGPVVTARMTPPIIRTEDASVGGTGKGERMTMTATGGESMTLSDTVDLRVPADPAYLAVLRTATAGLAARLD